MDAEKQGYIKYFLMGLNDVRLNQQLFDFKIVVGEKIYNAHKLVLAANSEYFRLMFSSALKESKENTVTIEDIDPDIMEAIIKFCYTQEISVNDDNFLRIIVAASRFCIESLVEECLSFISSRITVSNCLELLDLSESHKFDELNEKAFRFCLHNFSNVLEIEFGNIQERHWELVLPCDRLNISEKDLFRRFVEWTERDLVNRTSFFDRMAEHFRFATMGVSDLIVSSRLKIVRDSKSCQHFMERAKHYRLLGEYPELREVLVPGMKVTARGISPLSRETEVVRDKKHGEERQLPEDSSDDLF